MRQIGLSEVRQALTLPDTVLVDARLPSSYAKGHLPGAINIPIGTPQAQRRKIMYSVPVNAKVIIYCQSATCPFSDEVAGNLHDDGYFDLSIFREGWVAWPNQRQQTEMHK